MKKLVISIALSLCTLLATAPGSIGAQSTHGQTVLKVLDINVWSGLDYVGKLATFHFEDATQVVGVKIVINRKPVYIYATHWHASLSDSPDIINKIGWLINNGEASREEHEILLAEIKAGVAWRMSEAGKTLAFIRETAGKHPVILMGDFNAESRSQEIQTLIDQGFTDTFAHLHADAKGYTWDPATNLNQQMHYLKNDNPGEPLDLREKIEAFDKTLPSRIDYIFAGPQDLVASGRITVQNSRVVLKNIIDGVHASDHYGIYTEFLIGK